MFVFSDDYDSKNYFYGVVSIVAVDQNENHHYYYNYGDNNCHFVGLSVSVSYLLMMPPFCAVPQDVPSNKETFSTLLAIEGGISIILHTASNLLS